MTHRRRRAPSFALPALALALALASGTAARPQSGEDAALRPAPAAMPAASAEAPGASPAAEPAPQAVAGQPPASAPATASTLPHDLSPWSMFLNADVVVKAVMIGLLAASVATWTIWLGKTLQLATARRRALRGLRALAEADDLAALSRDLVAPGPVAALVATAAAEVERSGGLPADGIKERAALALGRVEARAARRITQGTGLLATVGSTAPFVGLFGTVWGIMNSFVGISQAHTSNLAVVAPGIAEALLATAVGLVAAIPAVVIFNGFARSTAGYRALLGDASAEVLRHLSRDLDRRPALRRQAAE